MTATLTTLVNFPYYTSGPGSSLTNLIADAQGDLFGEAPIAPNGDGENDGLVFEIAKTGSGYASTPTTVATFDGAAGVPVGGLVADANGDLFGTTQIGGANDLGTVFEIAKTPTGYATAPTPLVSFSLAGGYSTQAPQAGLIVDANGDLFGTTELGGANGDGTVFEIKKTPTGYASTPTTLVSFNYTDGAAPFGSLIADANGDLFGTTSGGGVTGEVRPAGTVFEIKKTAGGYANTPTTLASFNIYLGAAEPLGGLIADANGDLFGTTHLGGVDVSGAPLTGDDGTVFEIAKTASGYASVARILATFQGPNGSTPVGGLIADAAGDLFGTTSEGGADSPYGGTVFEIAKTPAGYASAPITLVSFDDGADGGSPQGSLIADAKGDLFGTTVAHDGTVFEVTGSGFGTPPSTPATSDIFWQNASGQAAIWDANGTNIVGGWSVDTSSFAGEPGVTWTEIGAANFSGDGHPYLLWQATDGEVAILDLGGTSVISAGILVRDNTGPSWKMVGIGDFNGDGISDILLQNTATGQAAIWEMSDGTTIIGGGAVSPNPGPSWKPVGTGDFNDDGLSDILWQNTSTGQVAIWEMNGTNLIGGGTVGVDPGPSWKAIGTGDFNHDGRSDILFQNTSSGQVAIWEMNGANIIGGGVVGVDPGPSWRAVGTGGGGSDILFQSTSGQVAIWDMSGTSIIGGGTVSASPGAGWRAVGLT